MRDAGISTGRITTGSVTERLLRDQGAPNVAVAGSAAAERVVFGVDFSPASLGAARWAAGHLATAGVTRTAASPSACVAHVVPWSDGEAPPDGADGDRPLRGTCAALLGGLAGFTATLPLAQARAVVRVGRPSAWLGALAAAEDARLPVLGRRWDAARYRIGEPKRGAAEAPPESLGSVARDVMARCPAPVLAVEATNRRFEERPVAADAASVPPSGGGRPAGRTW